MALPPKVCPAMVVPNVPTAALSAPETLVSLMLKLTVTPAGRPVRPFLI